MFKSKKPVRLSAELEAARQQLLASPLHVPKWLKDKLDADPIAMAKFNYIHYGTINPDQEVKKLNESEKRWTLDEKK